MINLSAFVNMSKTLRVYIIFGRDIFKSGYIIGYHSISIMRE